MPRPLSTRARRGQAISVTPSFEASPEAPPIGLFAFYGFRIPFGERIARLASAGFTHTSLWWPEDNAALRTLRHDAPTMVRDAGVGVDSIHVPYRDAARLWSEDGRERRRTIDRHRAWVGDCALHGVPRLIMHACLGPSTPAPSPEALEDFTALVEEAEMNDVTLCIENTRSPAHTEALLGAFDTPAVALCLDTSHDYLYGGPESPLLPAWADRVAAIHLNDTDGRRDYHWLPGDGVIAFDPIVDQLVAGGFAGPWMLESVGYDRNETPEDFLARAYTRARAVAESAMAAAGI